MGMIAQFNKLNNLILDKTVPPVQSELRNQLALLLEQIEAYQEASDKQDETLANQIKTIEGLMKEKQAIESELSLLKHEDAVIHDRIEFRRGKRTLNKWLPFCPKCHLPITSMLKMGNRILVCSSRCGWEIFSQRSISEVISDFSEEFPN